MLKTRKTMVSWQVFPSLPPRAPLAFLSHLKLACENIRFSSLFAAGDVSSARNVPSDEERGETDVSAG